MQSLLVVGLLYELGDVLLGFLEAAVVFQINFPHFQVSKEVLGVESLDGGCCHVTDRPRDRSGIEIAEDVAFSALESIILLRALTKLIARVFCFPAFSRTVPTQQPTAQAP